MRKFLFALFFMSSVVVFAEATPVLTGKYIIAPQSKVLYTSMELRSDGSLILQTSKGDVNYLPWVLKKDILFIGNLGYYTKWSKRTNGQWQLHIIPATEGMTTIYAIKEF